MSRIIFDAGKEFVPSFMITTFQRRARLLRLEFGLLQATLLT